MIATQLHTQIIVGRAEVWLRRLEAGSIPLIITSPPYNLNRRAASAGAPAGITRGIRRLAHSRDDAPYAARGGHGKWRQGTAYDGTTDDLPHAAYVAWQQDVLRACWRALAPSGAIYYVHKPRVRDGHCITPLDYLPDELRGYLRQIVIWRRAGGVNMAPTHYMPTHEWVVILARPAFRLKSKGASGVGDVWDIPQEPNTWHPAPFPEVLVTRILDTVGLRRVGLVCDPFMGSGTVGRVARRHGIDFIGIEQSPVYAERARREIAVIEGRALPPTAGYGPLFDQEVA